MRSRVIMFLAAVLVAMVLSELRTPVRAAEVVHFSSAVLPPSPFKLRQARAQGKQLKQQPGTPLWGHLDKPAGTGPFPVLVLMHGCNGIHQSDARWAALLTKLGYVTLILDSFRPRSLFSVCQTPVRIASPTMRALDAHGALAYLQRLAFVDADRIGLVGWSHGGIAALGAVSQFGIAHHLDQRFRAAVAFYPYCIADRSYELPILILMGESDDWTPVGICRELQSRSTKQGIAIELVTYPGAFHGFDVPELKQGWSVKGADGRDHRLKYDKKAHVDAIKRVQSFLARHLLRR